MAATNVDRETALTRADELVTEWTEQVKNPRGYVHDKWSPVDLDARTTATLRLAVFLLVPTGPLVAPAAAPPDQPHADHFAADCPGPPECL